jgi:5-methyltetrahydrofolate--homocysteine methyltransferase
VAGVLGPANRTATISPDVNDPAFRNITFDQLRATYRDGTRGLIKGGADVMMIETVFDTLNCKAAIFAIEEVFDEDGRAPAGLDFRHHHRPVRPHPDRPDPGSFLAFGAPCQSLRHRPQLRPGRQGTAALCGRSGGACDTLVSAHPNAGLPNEFGGYDETPETMSVMIGEFARSGLVNIVGGCCGTKPEHIKAFGEAVAGVVPRARFRKSPNICGCRGWSLSR